MRERRRDRRQVLLGAVIMAGFTLALFALAALQVAAAGPGKPAPAVTQTEWVPGPSVTVTFTPATAGPATPVPVVTGNG